MSAAVTQAPEQDGDGAYAADALLEMRSIRKTFGPVTALDDVSLTARAGELHALMGENGAGKSTLMKILSGAYTADPGGLVLIDGQPLELGHPELARRAGIAVIYQELSLSPNLSVAENLFLGREIQRWGMVARSEMSRQSQSTLSRLGVEFTPDTKVSELSLGERQLVEIARALASQARLIVMDEPTTSLSTRETERLFEVIRSLKQDGIAIIYISHRMEEIYELADRCSVLRDGQYVGTMVREELSASRLVSMMVGRELSSFYQKDASVSATRGEVILSVRNLGDGVNVKDCSFETYTGEVLGIAGLVGSGRTELARMIFGADKAESGTLSLKGRPVSVTSPQEAFKHGIAYLTEDRKTLGLFLDMTLSENVNIGVMSQDAHGLGLRDFAVAERRAKQAVQSLSIRTPGIRIPVGSLSGGNQQKVLLARLLETEPEVIILDEPTRGVDVGAKAEIYRLIEDLSHRGISVIVISSELPEILGVSDRVLVMRDKTIAGELLATPESPLNQEDIIALATGADTQARGNHGDE